MADDKTQSKGERRYAKPAKIVNKTKQPTATQEIASQGSSAPQPDVMAGTDGIGVNERHVMERGEMLDRHMAEYKDMHSRHQKEHGTLSARHAQELGGPAPEEKA